MAKMSAINKNNRRIKLSDRFFNKRKALKKIAKLHWGYVINYRTKAYSDKV